MKRTNWVALFLFLFILIPIHAASAASLFTITQQKGVSGFTESGKFYSIGMDGDKFKSQFGEPEDEKSYEDDGSYMGGCTWLNYYSDGFGALIDSHNKLKSVSFYVSKSPNKGIAIVNCVKGSQTLKLRPTGLSVRQLSRIYGKTLNRVDYGANRRYDFTESAHNNISFSFKGGSMASVTLGRK